MKKSIITVLLAILLFSCADREEVVEQTYPDGTLQKEEVYTGKDEKRRKTKETRYYEDGKTEITGGFSPSGKREGKWSYWFKNGKLWSECEYKNGLRHGKSTVWFDNGQKRYEGQYLNDLKTGNWKFWDINGKLAQEMNFDQE